MCLLWCQLVARICKSAADIPHLSLDLLGMHCCHMTKVAHKQKEDVDNVQLVFNCCCLAAKFAAFLNHNTTTNITTTNNNSSNVNVHSLSWLRLVIGKYIYIYHTHTYICLNVACMFWFLVAHIKNEMTKLCPKTKPNSRATALCCCYVIIPWKFV